MEIDFNVSAFGFGTPMTLADPLRRKRYLSFSSVVGYTQNPGQWIFEGGYTVTDVPTVSGLSEFG